MQFLIHFFMWCTIINGGLLILWVLCQMIMPGMLYRTQVRFFPMDRERFNQVFYLFLGIYKIFFVIFNAVPYIVLLIIS